MTGRRWILAGALVLLVGIGLVWISRTPPVKQVTLPDGSLVKFAAISYGKSNCWPPDSTWKRYLTFLPKPILSRLGVNSGFPIPLPTNNAIIWLFASPPSSLGVLQTGVRLALLDENDAEASFRSFVPYSYPPPAGTQNALLRQGIGLGAFPRRTRTFKLRLYFEDYIQGKRSLLGDLSVPNPAFRKYPEWQPTPLPATQTDAGVTIALTNLLTGVRQFESKPAASNEEPWGQAFFVFTQDGKACNDWAVDTIEFSDATGNRASPTAWGWQQTAPDRGTFNFLPVLWPAESAWKLDVACKRKDGAAFADTELWIIPDLPVPATGSPVALNLKTNLNGVSLELLSLANQSSTLPGGSDSGSYQLVFRGPVLPPGLRFDVVSVTGREDAANSSSASHSGHWSGSSGGPGSGDRSFTYFLSKSARTLDVRVAVYRQLTAQFLVKPNNLSPTANPAPR